MFMSDTLKLDAPRRTSDGYLAVRARAARTGAYAYSGTEVDPENKHGLRDAATVNVLRDADEVFSERAVHSFLMKPITDNHPREAVTARNWKDHARGTVAKALRDGDHLAFDLILMDQGAIEAVDAGKRELSNGYSCTLEFGDFQAADGTKCQARQTNITGNHVALVDRGRAGPECRISDAALCDALPANLFPKLNDGEPIVPKIITLDGYSVDIANPEIAEKTINTLRDARDAAATKATELEGTVTARDATIVAKDAEIVKLTADVAAAKLTPQQMRDAGKAYAVTVAKAKASGVTVTDEMDEAAIMKAVVDKAMPGNTYTADHVAIAFEALTKDAKVEDSKVVSIGAPAIIGDAETALQDAQRKAADYRRNAWKTPATSAAA